MNHLSDDQLADWLAGEADQETEMHLQSCTHCHTEAAALRNGVSRYALTLRQQSARAQVAQLDANFAPRKALALHRLRWAAAGVLAMLLTGQTVWMLKLHHAPASSQSLASTPAHSQSAAADDSGETNSKRTLEASAATALRSQTATSLSDDELLEAVNSDLSRDVPQALAPVSAITVARNKFAAASGNADLQGEKQQ
jgi:hypothetical protein